MNKPNLEALTCCIDRLAQVMDMEPLLPDATRALLEHLLFSATLDGVKGRETFEAVKQGLITEREFRNVVLAHCERKICHSNGRELPPQGVYLTHEIVRDIEHVLLGRKAKRHPVDVTDRWEQMLDE